MNKKRMVLENLADFWAPNKCDEFETAQVVFTHYPFPDLGKFVYPDQKRTRRTHAIPARFLADDFCRFVPADNRFPDIAQYSIRQMEIHGTHCFSRNFSTCLSFCDCRN